MRRIGLRHGLSRALAATVGLSALVAVGVAPARAATAEPDEGARECSDTVVADTSVTRQIDLVIDDSGSMFKNEGTGEVLQRWSQAKYSLEVFAAMLEAEDRLQVFRMSDFSGGRQSGPVLEVSGSQSVADRVATVHGMQMGAYDTPWSTVTTAMDYVRSSTAESRWLVILTDGAFEGVEASAVQPALESLVAGSTPMSSIRVAFLAIGGAPAVTESPGIVAEEAPDSAELVSKMTGFSNLIFQRDEISPIQPGRIDPDVDLEQVLVFAQGSDVQVGDIDTQDGSVSPSSIVQVQWAPNASPVGPYGDIAEPDRNLNGILALYDDVPAGSAAIDITPASANIGIFFKPRVSFGLELVDGEGQVVDESKIVSGSYTLNYGLQNASCEFIESSLLKDIAYSATITKDGQVVASDVADGTKVELPDGDVELTLTANYLVDNSASVTVQRTVLKAARPTTLEAEPASFEVSTLTPASDQAVDFEYRLASGEPFDEDEWAAVDPADILVTSDSDLEFDVELGDGIGDLRVIPHAPDGDVLAADTGEIPLHVEASFVYDEQLYETAADTEITVVDDIPFWDRFVDWFGEIGWKLLLLALLLVLILGYVFKRRFPKKVRRRPTIEGIPATVGVRPETGAGKFEITPLRRFLPFVADRASMRYVLPGVVGFSPLKLRAGKGKSMVLENWKQVAQRGNVEIGGTELNSETRRPPVLRASTTIVARTPTVQYEMTPNA